MLMQSDYIIDEMQDSSCCLKCRTLEDPFGGCACKQEELMSSYSLNNK
ncbi:MAG: hypothetical protein IJ880_03800 [Bacilli bacterium]|nr:hypothetical protein [Bacilli bacterium]MBR3119811.1 hypothetical protein [Oceanobacillus sp.]